MLERIPLLKRQAVRLGNDRDDVDDLTQLLHDNDIDGPEGVARRVDEEECAVDTRVLDMAVALRSELLAQVRAVLVLNVLDNRVPAGVVSYTRQCGVCGGYGKGSGTHGRRGYAPVFVVDLVAVAGRVDDVEPELHAILDNDYSKR